MLRCEQELNSRLNDRFHEQDCPNAESMKCGYDTTMHVEISDTHYCCVCVPDLKGRYRPLLCPGSAVPRPPQIQVGTTPALNPFEFLTGRCWGAALLHPGVFHFASWHTQYLRCVGRERITCPSCATSLAKARKGDVVPAGSARPCQIGCRSGLVHVCICACLYRRLA